MKCVVDHSRLPKAITNSLACAIFIRSNDPTYEPEGQYRVASSRVAFGTDNTRALLIMILS